MDFMKVEDLARLQAELEQVAAKYGLQMVNAGAGMAVWPVLDSFGKPTSDLMTLIRFTPIIS